MEFASKFFLYEDDDSESVDYFGSEALNSKKDKKPKKKQRRGRNSDTRSEENDLEEELSDDDDIDELLEIEGSSAPIPPPPPKGQISGKGKSKPQSSRKHVLDELVSAGKLRKVRKADTNVCAINLGLLADDGVDLCTGDPQFCAGCKVVLTEISNLVEAPNGGDEKLWVCEFCGHNNILDLDEHEIPKSNSLDYLLSPPSDKKSSDTDIVLFCIDTSNSMCVTQEVSSDHFTVKANRELQSSLNEFIETTQGGYTADQYLPGESRDVTYVSRLQCVQAAVCQQLETLLRDHPNKRVVIVTFSSEVTVHLSAGKIEVVRGDHLCDYDYLSNIATKFSDEIPCIRESYDSTVKIVQGLQESGATALGPALVVSVGIASKSKGSAVVLCTDGIANIGLGSLEGNSTENDNHPAPAFYKKVSDFALQGGTSVSIVSIKGRKIGISIINITQDIIKGTNTSLEHLARVARATRGYNDVVNPLDLGKNFNFILENSIIATDVEATMFLHRGLKFRHLATPPPPSEGHVTSSSSSSTSASSVTLTKDYVKVGNVTKESNITFEYSLSEKSAIKGLTKIPFQIQIRFTKLNGAKCMRVLSKAEEITSDRNIAEENVNVNVVGLHSQMQAAKLAAEGNYTKARMMQKSNMRMVRRTLESNKATVVQKKQYNLWNREATRLNSAIKKTKMKELLEGLNYDSAEDDEMSGSDWSDSEDNEEAEQKQASKFAFMKRKKAREQRRTENDNVSNQIYQAANPLFSAFTYNANPLYDNKKK